MNLLNHYFTLLLTIYQVHSFQVWRSCPWISSNQQLAARPSSDEMLPSAYDVSLPAGLRGEAVRSALESDRGVCVDFTAASCSIKNVGVVKVSGKGTPTFLNSKLSNSFSRDAIRGERRIYSINGVDVLIEKGEMKEAGILNSKGHIIDVLTTCSFIADDLLETYLITSPGHDGSKLFERLDPFIFPLDEVKLLDICPCPGSQNLTERSRVFAFLSTDIEVAKQSIKDSVFPFFQEWQIESFFSFPSCEDNNSMRYSLPKKDGGSIELVIWEQTVLPPIISKGYCILISEKKTETVDDDAGLGSKIWEWCTAEKNMYGPVEIGPLEYETLRIEGGQSAFGFEMTGHVKDKDSKDESVVYTTKCSPLELHLDHVVDVSKGCYQGQEGIAALLKNKRGLPRNLYSVIFPDEDNTYEGEQVEEEYFSDIFVPNVTRLPKVRDNLYVLGSNKQIKVGTLTSVAEQGGTSKPETVALALVLRAETILKRMKDMDLEIERDSNTFASTNNDFESGIIMPPPIDPLDGLEVVLENGMTRGYLRVIPPLRRNKLLEYPQYMSDIPKISPERYDEDEATSNIRRLVHNVPASTSDNNLDMPNMTSSDATLESAHVGVKESNGNSNKISNEGDAIAEAKRKAEKMEMLKKRAEEVLSRRQKRKE